MEDEKSNKIRINITDMSKKQPDPDKKVLRGRQRRGLERVRQRNQKKKLKN